MNIIHTYIYKNMYIYMFFKVINTQTHNSILHENIYLHIPTYE